MWLIYIWLTSLTFSSLMATDIILKSSTITHVIILNWNTVERTNQEHIQNKIIIFVSHCKCEIIIFVSHCKCEVIIFVMLLYLWSYYICFTLQVWSYYICFTLQGVKLLYLLQIAGWATYIIFVLHCRVGDYLYIFVLNISAYSLTLFKIEIDTSEDMKDLNSQ